MKRFPSLSSASPVGTFNRALVAMTPSARSPAPKVLYPATVEMIPVEVELIRSLALSRRDVAVEIEVVDVDVVSKANNSSDNSITAEYNIVRKILIATWSRCSR